jgi:fructose-1,6-bisphosphatase/inositol monophosphatase family enzyme
MTLTQLESACIKGHRQGRETKFTAGAIFDETEWAGFGLSVLLEVGQMVRRTRLLPMEQLVDFKPDGSPVTTLEYEIEALVHERLTDFCSEAAFLGEERGGDFPAQGIAVALDSVDGTWSLINRTETCATSLVGFRDGKPFLGMVLNPVTGELAYTTKEIATRLIQFSVFGEDDVACSLPADRVRPESVLVNLHPQRNVKALVGDLYEEWRKGGLNMVKLPGGSPSWAMLEAAKGSFVYVNLWSKRPTEPYDLAAGVMLVRGAGGDVTDLAGMSIDVLDHKGPFIAGIEEEARNKVAAIARDTLENPDLIDEP